MTARFRTGQIVASSDFLEVVPRSVFIAALVKHVTKDKEITSQSHEEHRFQIETEADGSRTHVRLEP